MLTIENLNQSYGQSHILHNISFTAPEKACTCIIGRNGVGKTTLLKAIMGQVAAQADTLKYGNINLLKQRPEKRPYHGILCAARPADIFPAYRRRQTSKSACPCTTNAATSAPATCPK